MPYIYKLLDSTNINTFRNLMKLFGEVFEDEKAYQEAKPSDNYVQDFLNDNLHIVLVALENDTAIGGLVAYELKKFERERSEIYIYDLAVSKDHQRKGVGTALVESLKNIAKERGAYTIFVQADKIDKEAISFYQKFRTSEVEAINFDIDLN